MNTTRLYQILRAPHISEKASRAADKHNQVVFEVLPGATKPEIKRAVETLFKVDVVSVQVVNVKGKVKRFGHTPGRRKQRRKAYVRLKAGQDIDFAGM